MEAFAADRSSQDEGKVGGAVESVPARRIRSNESRVCAAGRNDGPCDMGVGGVQLLSSRYGKYGGAASLRLTRAEGEMADAASQRRNKIVLRDDRTGRRIIGCYEHQSLDQGRRLGLHHQWA